MMDMDIFANRRVLFITTKNLDYLRNTQEISLLKQWAKEVIVIGSNQKSYAARLLKVYWNLFWFPKSKYDIAFVGFAPQLVVPFFKRKWKGKELVIDFFISMYDTFIFDRRKFKENGVIARVLKELDKAAIKQAEYVISDTRTHGRYFTEEFGLKPERLKVLYLEADRTIYYPRPCVKPERFHNRFTVLYFGSVLPLQGLDVILKAVALLKDNPDMYFVIIGPIAGQYEKPQGDNVEYHDWLSQEELAEYIGYSDLCLAGHFNREINKAKRTIPGKAYIYEAMEKPMILGDNPATRELYSEDMPGKYFVEMGNAEALANKIIMIAKENGV